MDKGAEAPLYWFINGESEPTTGGGILMIRTTNHRHAQTIAGWWFNGIMMINDG